MAESEWLPRARAPVESAAVPEETGAVPNDVAPSKNATVPVAAEGETVAVKVTLWPTVEGFGAVLIAGCRDAHVARQLGFVGVQGLGTAVEMAKGRGAERIAYLLTPPYFPLVAG